MSPQPQPGFIGRHGLLNIGRPKDYRFAFPAEVLEVVDGDTIDVVVDRAFGETTTIRVRLADINAPEERGPKAVPEGNAATVFVEQWLARRRGALVLYTDKGHPSTIGIGDGRFGRWLGDFKAGDEWLSDALVENGHAARGFRPR